jgi:hypothetical protein
MYQTVLYYHYHARKKIQRKTLIIFVLNLRSLYELLDALILGCLGLPCQACYF